MKILYGVLSQGQGHGNRAAALVSRLRARGHQVEIVLSGDAPPAYAQQVLGTFEHVAVPNLVIDDGRVRRTRTMLAFGRSLPCRLAHARRLARRIRKERVDLVVTDFEPLTAWAATLAGAPSVGVSGQYRITRTNAPSPSGASAAVVASMAIMNA